MRGRDPTSPALYALPSMLPPPLPTLDTLMQQAAARLRAAGDDSPHVCVRALAQAVTGLDRTGIILAGPRPLAPELAARLEEAVSRRCTGEPLAHILGQKEFFGRDFAVTADTLVPRPETELLVELALRHMQEAEAHQPDGLPLRLADLGAGSGCIGITLLAERPRWQGLLLDISPAALDVARRNARTHDVESRLCCLAGDMTQAPLAPRSLQLLVSNPPYISAAERHDVMADVLRHEPHTALFSPADGLAHLQAACRAAAVSLLPGGHLLLEHGWRQGEAVRTLLRQQGFANITTHTDLAGHERCTEGRLSSFFCL